MTTQHLNAVFQAMGWMHAECVRLQRAGCDLSSMEVPEVIERARQDLNLDQPIDWIPMPPNCDYARKMLLVAHQYLESHSGVSSEIDASRTPAVPEQEWVQPSEGLPPENGQNPVWYWDSCQGLMLIKEHEAHRRVVRSEAHNPHWMPTGLKRPQPPKQEGSAHG